MTLDLVTVTKWTLGQGPTLHRWSRDKPSPPHPIIVTGNIVGSPVVRTSTKHKNITVNFIAMPLLDPKLLQFKD